MNVIRTDIPEVLILEPKVFGDERGFFLESYNKKAFREATGLDVEFVKDRPGHDRRYAIDDAKLRAELGWKPKETFETGLRKTVLWYLDHSSWVDEVTSGAYRKWVETNYARRGAA